MDPKNKKCLFYRARSQKELEKFKEATETVASYLELFPEDIDGINLQKAIKKSWLED